MWFVSMWTACVYTACVYSWIRAYAVFGGEWMGVITGVHLNCVCVSSVFVIVSGGTCVHWSKCICAWDVCGLYLEDYVCIWSVARYTYVVWGAAYMEFICVVVYLYIMFGSVKGVCENCVYMHLWVPVSFWTMCWCNKEIVQENKRTLFSYFLKKICVWSRFWIFVFIHKAVILGFSQRQLSWTLGKMPKIILSKSNLKLKWTCHFLGVQRDDRR